MVVEERGGVPGWGENPLIPTQRERWLVRCKQKVTLRWRWRWRYAGCVNCC